MRILSTLSRLAVAGLCLGLVLGWFGALHPALDSFSHFRLHLSALLIPASVVAWLLAGWRWMLAGLAVSVISLALTWPHLPGGGPSAQASEKADIKVLQFNIYFRNWDMVRANALLTAPDADFVVLQEVAPRTEEVLATLKPSHPYQVNCPFVRVGNVAIASKHPFVAGTKPDCVLAYAFASARFQIGDREISIADFHSFWPWPNQQPRQIALLAERFRSLPKPSIIAGDFNAASWSHATKRVADLSETTIAPGLRLTWSPRQIDGPLTPRIGLAIDNILHSSELVLLRRKTLPQAGSDHLPVLSEYRWRH